MFRVRSIRKEYLTSLCMFWSISRPLLLSFRSACSMQIHTCARIYCLDCTKPAEGCCENNAVCLKKHRFCELSLDMETTIICGLKRTLYNSYCQILEAALDLEVFFFVGIKKFLKPWTEHLIINFIFEVYCNLFWHMWIWVVWGCRKTSWWY